MTGKDHVELVDAALDALSGDGFVSLDDYIEALEAIELRVGAALEAARHDRRVRR